MAFGISQPDRHELQTPAAPSRTWPISSVSQLLVLLSVRLLFGRLPFLKQCIWPRKSFGLTRYIGTWNLSSLLARLKNNNNNNDEGHTNNNKVLLPDYCSCFEKHSILA